MDTDGNMVGHDFLRSHATPHPKRDMFECLREDMFILPSASLILRKAFDAIGGFDENLSGYEDDDLFLRLFRAGYGNVFLETALSKWRIYPESSSYSYRMRRSRAIYFRKLWETYQDDPSRARWIKRDLLIPRFYMHALAEYLKAVNSRQPPSVINETRSELQYIVTRMPGWKRRVFGQMLSRLESQRLTNAAFRLRRYARPIYRRLL
jgi:GT2 family glycosyltransferase